MQRNQIINLGIGYTIASILFIYGITNLFTFIPITMLIGIVALIISVIRFYLTYKKYKNYTTQTNLIEDIENLGKEINKE